jgi:hypothetical protein
MSTESSGSGQQSDSEIGCSRLAVFLFASREWLLRVLSRPRASRPGKRVEHAHAAVVLTVREVFAHER